MTKARELADYLRLALPLTAKGYRRSLAMLRELETLSKVTPEELEKVVAVKKQALLEYLFDNVDWYRRRKGSLPSPKHMATDMDAWGELPLQSKDMIRNDEDAFIAGHVTLRSWNDTSGSTGKKFRFLKDEQQNFWAEASTAFVRKRITGEYVPAETTVWGAPRDLPPAYGYLTKLRHRIRRYHKIIAYRADREKLKKALEQLARNRSDLLTGYPNILALLAELDRDRVLGRHRAVLSAGEWLRPGLRTTIERHIGKKMFDFYGCREVGSIAYECHEHQGLHVLSPLIFLEVLRPDGWRCEPGEPGEIVVTSLIRRSMPLVRYRLGDMGEMSPDPCACGNPFPILRSLSGRTMDVVTLPGGEALVGNFWTFLSREVAGVSQFRVLQDSLGGITMEIVPGEDAGEDLQQVVSKVIAERLGDGVDVTVRLVRELPVNQSGKTGLVVSSYRRKDG